MQIVRKIKVVILLLVILGLAFYFFQVKSSQDRKEFLLNSIRCQQDGSQLFEKDKKDFLTDYDRTEEDKTFNEAEYVFSKDLNTCLYKGSYSTLNSTGYYGYKFIKDVYSNKLLIEYSNITSNGQEPLHGNKEKYEELENKYFNN